MEVITKEELDFNKDIGYKGRAGCAQFKIALSRCWLLCKEINKEDPSDVLGLKLLRLQKFESITKQLLSINEPVSLELVDINKVLRMRLSF